MSPKDPRRPSASPSKEERLAKALRENLARRKALARAKRAGDDAAPPAIAASAPRTSDRAGPLTDEDDAPS